MGTRFSYFRSIFFDIHFHFFFKGNDLGLLLTYFRRICISRRITILHKVILNFGMMYNIIFFSNAAFNLHTSAFMSFFCEGPALDGKEWRCFQ